MRILIVEDNLDIAGNLGDYLAARGHELDYAVNGDEGLRLAVAGTFDTIVLDVNLPHMNGFEVCRRLRTEYFIDTPVLMLTARGSLADKTLGFQVGAWDYVVKPFALEELELRLNALTLRQDPGGAKRLSLGDVILDLGTRTAAREGKPLQLHNIPFRILEALMRASPNVVSRPELEHLLWGEVPPDSDPLRSHMHELRKALDKPFDFAMLRTIHGVGYKLIGKDSEHAD